MNLNEDNFDRIGDLKYGFKQTPKQNSYVLSRVQNWWTFHDTKTD